MPETPGLRERKKQRTRRAIEAAALGLFEERGFEGTTIDDIAATAEIAPRTFFHYFPSKEDVVLSDYATRLDRIVAALEGTPVGKSAWEGLRAAFLSVAADYEDERDQLLRRFRVISENPSVAARSLQLQAAWEDAVAEAVAGWLDADGRQTIEPRLLAGAALAAMRASLSRWLTEGGRSRLPDHVDSCFTLLGSGLSEVGER